jgi:Tol biopolymer transport system component
LNGDNIRRLTYDFGSNFAPEISPDGSRIVFASTVGGDQNIWVMNSDGSGPIQITEDTRDDIDPTWSPDGTRISFTSSSSGSGNLMIINADGSGLRQITKGINVEGRNDWSPDGRHLTFYAGDPGDKNVYVVDTSCSDLPSGCDPSQLRQLTNGGNNKAPGFSPDGIWVTFASQMDGDNEVFIMKLDGTEIYQLTFNRRADWQPRWGWQP